MLLKLYNNQKAKIKTAGVTSEWFSVAKGVRQGCVLSPHLFNILAEAVMREALCGYTGGFQLRLITNFWYADDVILIATSQSELQQELVDRLDRAKVMVLPLHQTALAT